MRTPVEIYEQYRIPPSLQMHQLRVAAVGALVSAQKSEADERAVILTGLFHDMGNILKFDLDPTGPLTHLVREKGIAYWQSVKDDFNQKYGSDEHEATISIGREIGLSDVVVGLMHGIGFSHMIRIRNEGPLELHICEYADLRVGPNGVLPLQVRIADLKRRSALRWAKGKAKDMEEKFDHSGMLIGEIEKELFADTRLQPEDITDASVAPVIEELKGFRI